VLAVRRQHVRPLPQRLRGQVSVVRAVPIAGHAGAHVQLPHRLTVKLKHRSRQAIVQVIQKHRPRPPGAQLLRPQRIELAHAIAPRMLAEDAMPQHILKHAFGADRRDVRQPVVIIRLVLPAQGAQIVQEVTREQPQADAHLQDDDLVFEGPVLLRGLQRGEEDLGGIARQRPVVVDDERHRRGIGQKRRVAPLTEVLLTQ
jgi:hypothetical protein